MSNDIDFNVSEVVGLSHALGAAGAKALEGVRAVMSKGALTIKQDMQAEVKAGLGASPHSYIPRFDRSITYDVRSTFRGVEIEVGPDKSVAGAQGALGNLLAYGTSRQPAVWDHEAAMRRELPVIEKFISQVGVESLD